jgi:alkylation response protein AidB-like acyl-CoA dehydrogenase
MYAWMRQAWCLHLLEMLRLHITDARFERDFGTAYARVTAVRLVARRTLRRLAEGQFVGPEASIDKLLLSSSEQMLLNLARDVLQGPFELDDTPELRRWRADFFYTRSSTIYGGAAEIQRDIVAQRVLGLPRARG